MKGFVRVHLINGRVLDSESTEDPAVIEELKTQKGVLEDIFQASEASFHIERSNGTFQVMPARSILYAELIIEDGRF